MKIAGDTFAERRATLLRDNGIPDPPTAEGVRVKKILFSNNHRNLELEPLLVEAGPKTFIGCLYARMVSESLGGMREFDISPTTQAEAFIFFGDELIADAKANPGKHATIDGFLNYDHLTLTF